MTQYLRDPQCRRHICSAIIILIIMMIIIVNDNNTKLLLLHDVPFFKGSLTILFFGYFNDDSHCCNTLVSLLQKKYCFPLFSITLNSF